MQWLKSPPFLVERFSDATDVLLADPTVERRKMFGYPACFVGGHMFTGLHQDRWVVRLDEAGMAELTAAGGTDFEPMPGRPMRGFVVLPEAVRSNDVALAGWLDRALAHARSMPPKPGKQPRR
ncbi:MAG: TfoX/Sxy family protein [Candidatus Limnocylindria bacterium]